MACACALHVHGCAILLHSPLSVDRHADWLNIPPPAVLASDENVSQRHQPRADLKVHQREQVGQPAPAAEAMDEAEAEAAAAAAVVGREHDLPAAVKRVTCIGGVLRLPNE